MFTRFQFPSQLLVNIFIFYGLIFCGLMACSQSTTDDNASEGFTTQEEFTTDSNTCISEVPDPINQCIGARPDLNACMASRGDLIDQPTQIGSTHPQWILKDLQPQSCGYNQYYGLETFHGTPTIVVLLWAGCGFCQAQAEKLQQMYYEFELEEIKINFVILNLVHDNPPINKLSERCNFPIFQDVQTVDAWGLHQGKKDYFYFYDGQGILQIFIPSSVD